MAFKDFSNVVANARKNKKEEEKSSKSLTKDYSSVVDRQILSKRINMDTFETDLVSLSKTLSSVYNGWQTKEKMKHTLSSVQNMYDRISKYQEYQKKYGGTDLSDLQKTYKSVIDDWDNIERDYNKYKSADDYNTAIKNSKAQAEKMQNADIGVLDKEITNLQGVLKTAKEYDKKVMDLAKQAINIRNPSAVNVFKNTLDKAKNERDSYLKSIGYDSIETLEKELGEKEVFKNNAQQMQKGIELSSVGNPEATNYDKDYTKYIEAGKNIPTDEIGTSTRRKAVGHGRPSITPKVNDDLREAVLAAERKINGETSKTSSNKYDAGAVFDLMTDEEVNNLYYYIGKDKEDGGDRANEYLDVIKETLNSRRGEEIAKMVKDTPLGEAFFSLEAGLDQWSSGVKANLSDKDYIPSSPIQHASGIVREDLEYEHGAFARTMYDLGVTASNQLPSILVSSALGAVTGGVGAVGVASKVASGISKGAGLATMGISARGNAYQEMLNLGYNKDQADTYANLVGASEVGLQALLGGISKLGGTSTKISKLVSQIDNGLARFAIQYPMSMASESVEEGLQEILTPAFKSIAAGYDTGEKVDWGEVVYSSLLGGLMGGLFEGPGLVTSSIAEYSQNKNMGQTLKANERVSDMFDLASNPEIASAYDAYTKYAKKGITAENVSDAKLGRLHTLATMDAQNVLDSNDSTVEQRETAQNTLDTLGVYAQENVASRTGSAKHIDKDFLKDYTADDINAVIEEGLESAETTESYKIATELKAKVESGKSVTTTELAKLIEANDSAIRAEETTDITSQLVENGVTEEVSQLVSRKMRGETLTTKESEMILNSKEALSFMSERANADNVTAEVIEKAKAMNNEEGALFVSLYDGKTDVEAYTNAFNVVAMKASDNFTLNDALTYKGVLTNVQATKIYNELKIKRDNAKRMEFQKLSERTASLKAYNGVIDDSVIDYTNKSVEGKANWNSLPEATRTSVTFFKGLAQATGMNLTFITDGKAQGINGSYSAKDNTITVDLFAESFDFDKRAFVDSIVPTMSHELTHWTEKKSPVLFSKISGIVFPTLERRDGLTESERISMEIEKKLSKKYNGKIPADVLKNALTDSKRISEARSEIVARACEDMLSQSKVGKEMFNSLNKTEQKTLMDKVKDIIKDILNWIDEALGFYKSTSYEAKILRDYQEEYKKLSALWDEMLTESVEVNQALEKSGVFEHDVTSIGSRDLNDFSEAVGMDGEKLFQYRAMVEDEDIYRAMLLKYKDTIGITNKQINELFTTIDKAVDIISENLEALDYAWDVDINDRAFSPVKPNSDSLYKVSLDFSTLCRKRLLQQTIAQTLQNALDKNLSTEESIAIRDELLKVQEEGRKIEVACALCYVESARMKSPKQINKFLNGREAILKEFFANRSGVSIKEKIANAEMKARKALAKANPDGYYGKNDVKLDVLTAPKSHMKKADADYIRNEGKKAKSSYKLTEHEQAELDSALNMSVDDFTSAKGLENLAKNHPDLFDAYTSFVRNATHSKGIENDTWWRAGDSESIGDSLIAKMNEENGLRSQSWSDFQVIHLLDYIAATIELSTKGAKRQSYTKVPDYVKLLGNTGDMINISLIPAREFNGKLEYDSVEGMAYVIAKQLRDEYHETVGTICIGINNEQIKMLLEDATIDMVIPYHHSSMSKAVRKLMHIPAWETYQNYQGEKNLSDAEAKARAKEYGVKLNKDSNYQKSPNFSEWFNLQEARQIAKLENANPTDKEAYKKYGKMYGGYMAMRNAANKYLKLCAERGLAPKFSSEKADFTHDANYWKLLIDRKMVDNITGEIIEQKAIKPIFNEKHVLEILNDELKRYPEVKADQEYATRKVTEKFLSGEMKVDKSTLEAIKKPIDNVTKVNIFESSGEVLNSDMDSNSTKNLRGYSQHQIDNWKNSKSIVIYESESQFRGFVEDAISNGQFNKKIYLGAITKEFASLIKEKTNIDVENFNCSLSASEIRKIFKDHGVEEKEALRGQRAVTVDDILNVREVLQNPEEISLSQTKYNGKPIIHFVKNIDGKYTVTAVVSDKHLDLFVQTLYIGIKKRNLSTPIAEQAAINTPEASSGTVSNDSISNQDKNVNTLLSESDSEGVVLNSERYDVIDIPFSMYSTMEEHFGITKNYEVAGYLLADGKMLDFSGKHWGDDTSTFRQVDHRDIQEVLEDEHNGVQSMVSMISNGNIRLMPEVGGINLAKKPNGMQTDVLRGYINHFKGEVTVDIDAIGGDTIHSFEYSKGTSASKILSDLDGYFNRGEIPTRTKSSIAEFLYSDRADLDAYDIMGESERLAEENAKLDADAEKLRGILRTEEVANRRFLALANYLKKTSGSSMDSAILGRKLKDAYTSMQSSESLNWQSIASLTHSIAESVMNKDLGISSEQLKKVMQDIRNDKISLSKEQRARIEERFGSYGNFHKYIFGRVNVTKDGTPLEKAWGTWSKKYPSFFDASAVGSEQIDALIKAVDALRATSSIMGEYEHQEAIRYLSTEIYNQFWNIATDSATVDEAKAYRTEHKALMENLRKDYEKRQKDLATHPIGETALKYESLLRKVQERKKKDIARAKEHGREMMDKYKENAERKTKIQSITSVSLSLNEYLIKNSKDKHVPEIMREPVTALLQAIDFSSKRMIEKGEPTQKDISLSKALGKVKDMMVKATNAHDELVELYGHGLDEDIEKMVDNVDNIMRSIGDNEFVLNRMSLEDLQTLDKMVKTIRHAVNKLNNFHTVNHAKVLLVSLWSR